MDFKLSDEQRETQRVVRDFVSREVMPKREEFRKEGFPWDMFGKMAELGLAGGAISETYGGLGSPNLTTVIITEEIARADAGLSLSLASQSLVGKPIEMVGTEEQKKMWLPKIASGEILAAYGQTEPEAGSDVASIKTRAVVDGGEFVINGTKLFITNGSVSKLILLLARTESEGKPHKGLSMILVDAEKAKADGTLKMRDEHKVGLHCSPTTELSFENCRVPVANLLGAAGMGFYYAMGMLTCSRAMIAAQSVGLAQAALDCATEQIVSRRQFGEEIARFQMIQSDLAEMATKVEAARLLTYRAAIMIDEMGFMRALEFMKEASMAKFYAATVAKEVASKAADMFGGMGFMAESRIAAILQDVGVLSIYEGTSNIQKVIIARQILRESGLSV